MQPNLWLMWVEFSRINFRRRASGEYSLDSLSGVMYAELNNKGGRMIDCSVWGMGNISGRL